MNVGLLVFFAIWVFRCEQYGMALLRHDKGRSNLEGSAMDVSRLPKFVEEMVRVRGPDCTVTVNEFHSKTGAQITVNDEVIPIQPEQNIVGECKEVSECIDPRQMPIPGLCPGEPADVKCCIERPCTSFDDREGVCMKRAKCNGDNEAISDIVYAGIAQGAKGCRDLPDDIMCCVPTTKETLDEIPSLCDEMDALYCATTVAKCTDKCISSVDDCMGCLRTEADEACCPCLQKEFPELENLVCTPSPCLMCANVFRSCRDSCGTTPDVAECLSCLQEKELSKCCPCAKKFFPSSSLPCGILGDCAACATSLVQTCKGICSTGTSVFGCAACIMEANADDCCDCLRDAIPVGVSAKFPSCPLPDQCKECGSVFTQCEVDCVTSFDTAKCTQCLTDNGGAHLSECCSCVADIVDGVNPSICSSLGSTVGTVENAVDNAGNSARNAVENARDTARGAVAGLI